MKNSKSHPTRQAARKNERLQCPICERTFRRRARQQRHCSTRCRKQAWRKTPTEALKKLPRYPYSGGGTNPPKKLRDLNALQGQKSGSRPHICGPRSVIESEIVAGRKWTEVVSADGVRGFEIRLRAFVETDGWTDSPEAKGVTL